MAASDIRPPFAIFQPTLGVDAVVTVPGGSPVAAVVIWVAPVPQDMPLGEDFSREDPRRVLAIARADVPLVPTGTVIEAPESAGGETLTWRVDGIERVEYDHVRAMVLETEGAS